MDPRRRAVLKVVSSIYLPMAVTVFPQGAPRVLVVDDEPAVRALLLRVFGEAGYDVVAVPDGEAGLAVASTTQAPYDLVVTNTYLPSLSGEQLIAHLRELYPDPPILHVDDLAHPRGSRSSPAPALYKPFSIDALLDAVAVALSEHRRRSEA